MCCLLLSPLSVILAASQRIVIPLTDLKSLTSIPAVIKYDLGECEVCAKLDPFWGQVAKIFEGQAYQVDCSVSYEICDEREVRLPQSARDVPPFSPHREQPQPLFDFWSGDMFHRYEGKA